MCFAATTVFPKLCAVEDLQLCHGFFTTLNIYARFQLELSNCCHEVTVGNVWDPVMLPEKVVNSKKKVTFRAITCNAISDQC